MIRFVVKGSKYTHKDSLDVYFEVLESEDRGNYYQLTVLWKTKTTVRIIGDNSQSILLHKDKLTEWFVWQKSP